MDDPVKWFKDIGAPSWLILTIVVLVGATIVVGLLDKLKPFFEATLAAIGFMARSERRRSVRLRRLFADHLESRLRLLNNQEEWSDARFTDLEAEVEYERSRSLLAIVRFMRRTSLRQAKSLSKALRSSKDRLIILQGDPGAGKSVALRHVALRMCRSGTRSPSTRSIIPLYINLRDWRPDGSNLNGSAVREYILQVLNRPNLRDVTEFLDANFDQGVQNGSWLFLFDSFDEIPDILSASEADETIQRYRNAIYEFLTGFNTCRGIIASREFRGPSTYGLSTFRILQLSAPAQRKLIRRSGLATLSANKLIASLNAGEEGLRNLASNPMFLGLICEQARETGEPPQNTHQVYETYVTRRLTRDSSAVEQRFSVNIVELRDFAEQMAFGISNQRLGLSPTIAEIRQMATATNFDSCIAALTYTKLLRRDLESTNFDEDVVSFAHRRFQEYFATCVVLRKPDVVPARTLLRDGRWREAAVTILLTQSESDVKTLVDSATRMLDYEVSLVESLAPDAEWEWRPGLFHLLGILNAGAVRSASWSPRISRRVDILLKEIDRRGLLVDKKLVLDVSGSLDHDAQQTLYTAALEGQSQWLRAAAYRQIGRLASLTGRMRHLIQLALFELDMRDELARHRSDTMTYLKRLPDSSDFVRSARLLLVVRPVDLVLLSSIGAVAFTTTRPADQSWFQMSATFLFVAGLVFAAHATLILYSRLAIAMNSLRASTPRTAIRGVRGERETESSAQGAIPAVLEMTWGAGRFYPALMTWLLLADARPVGATSWQFLILAIYISLWGPGARCAALSGRLTRPLLWWLHPMYFAWSAVRTFCVTVVTAFVQIKSVPKLLRAIVFAVLSIAILVVIFALIWLGVTFISRTPAAPVFAAILFVVGLAVIGVVAYNFFHPRVRDWRELRASRKNLQVVGAQEFMQGLSGFSTESGVAKYLRLVRDRQALQPGLESLDVLRALLRNGEYTYTGLVRVRKGNTNRRRLSQDQLDNIAQLAEEVARA